MTKLVILLGALSITACASSSHVMTGAARPAISPAEVKIYTSPPSNYQQIALLDAHRSSIFGRGGQKSTDSVVERLKVQAAQLGANGLLLKRVDDRQVGSLGNGVGTDAASNNSTTDVGTGESLATYDKSGTGTAIYVPTG